MIRLSCLATAALLLPGGFLTAGTDPELDGQIRQTNCPGPCFFVQTIVES